MSMLDLALLIMRFVLGIVFIRHGSEKLFSWFGGKGKSGLTASMKNKGVVFALQLSWMAALSEFFGGLLVLIGLLTPLAASLTISTMLVAIFTVHLKNGFSNNNRGYEFNLTLVGMAVPLVLLGAGSVSIDNLLGIAHSIDQFPAWVPVVLVLVSLGGIGSYELFRRIGSKPSVT